MSIQKSFVSSVRPQWSVLGLVALGLLVSAVGCGPPGAAGEEKMRMDRLSIQRTTLLKEADEKDAKIISLQDELTRTRKELADLKSDLKARLEAPRPTTSQPTTKP